MSWRQTSQCELLTPAARDAGCVRDIDFESCIFQTKKRVSPRLKLLWSPIHPSPITPNTANPKALTLTPQADPQDPYTALHRMHANPGRALRLDVSGSREVFRITRSIAKSLLFWGEEGGGPCFLRIGTVSVNYGKVQVFLTLSHPAKHPKTLKIPCFPRSVQWAPMKHTENILKS